MVRLLLSGCPYFTQSSHPHVQQRTSGVAVVLFVLLSTIVVRTSDAVPLSLASSLLPKVEMGTPIRGADVKFGDGDVVGGKTYIYKCKICDMPRIFVMNYGSFIF